MAGSAFHRFPPADAVGRTTPGRAGAGLAVLLLAAAAAGCGPANSPSAAGQTSHPSASSRTKAQAQARTGATGHTSCLVGDWVSTHEKDNAPGVFSESGGARVRMRVRPSGAFDVEFGGMTPVRFTAEAGAEKAGGFFTFSGGVTGKAKLPSGGLDVIQWEPAPSSLDYSTLTVTVHITSPIVTTVGPMNIAGMTSQLGASSSAIDSHPFERGTFTCTDNGNTLISASPPGMKASGTWTFKRR